MNLAPAGSIYQTVDANEVQLHWLLLSNNHNKSTIWLACILRCNKLLIPLYGSVGTPILVCTVHITDVVVVHWIGWSTAVFNFTKQCVWSSEPVHALFHLNTFLMCTVWSIMWPSSPFMAIVLSSRGLCLYCPLLIILGKICAVPSLFRLRS